MKAYIISAILVWSMGYISPSTDNDYSIEQVSICRQSNATQCLSPSQKNQLNEDTPYSVEVILKSNNANLLNDQIQAIQLEVCEISLACARSSTNLDNCPSGSCQEWKTLYQNSKPSTGNTLTLINSTKLTKQLSNKQFTWRNDIKQYPVEILSQAQKLGSKPNLTSSSLAQKPPYYLRIKADNVRFPDWVWGIRVSVYQRDGGKQQSQEFKTRF
jgi:hypothetical protein